MAGGCAGRTYSSGSVMKSFWFVVYFFRTLYQNHHMIRSLAIRDLQTRYVGSFLGLFWSVVHPITQLLLYTFIFSVVLNVKLAPEYGKMPYVFWLMAGLMPWFFFAEMVSRSPGAVLGQSSVIKKMVFPSEILPFANLAAALINHFINMFILIVLVVAFGYGISWKIVLLLPYLLAIGILATGIAWILSALNVFLRDIGQILGVVMRFWLFLTPILYPASRIPERFHGLMRLNPMLHAVEGYRMALFGKTSFDLAGFSYLLFVGLVIVVVGGLTFRKLKPAFADVL
jgi:ABC-type polysaccharide/polyol phosphate export permease